MIKGSILTALENVNRLSVELRKQDGTLKNALDDLPAALASVNGQPGAVGYDAAGLVFCVFELEVADGLVQAIRGVVNPDKLRHIGPVSDVARLPEKELPHRHSTQEGSNR